MLSCREVVNRSSDLLDGELAGLSRFQMRLHLFMCHRCRSFLDFLTRLHRELPELVVQDGDGEAVDRIANQVTGRIATRSESTGAPDPGAADFTGDPGTGDRDEP